MSSKKRGLGRGLGALLDDANEVNELPKDVNAGGVNEIPIKDIETNPFQPRTLFEEEALQELSQSIKVHGIIQPITVRQKEDGSFQLISGERRFRASQLAGLKRIPAYVRQADDQTVLEMALVENIQRENLNAIEVALSYQRLMEECDLTQEQLSGKVAKNRTTISNHLRLLKLPIEIQLGIRDKDISMGHARALVSVADQKVQLALFHEIIEKKLSVRDTEKKVREIQNPEDKVAKKEDVSAEDREIESKLRSFFDTNVELKKAPNGKGKITISFKNEDELNRILKAVK